MRKDSGFSLVELSVVLMVIALVVGGIMAGANIRRTAELKSIPEDVTQIAQAVSTFKSRFEYLPGDMLDATSQWGASATNCASASTGTETCNGDGNGWVTTAGTASTYGEAYLFWQHLANARLWDGRFMGHYTGTSGSLNCLAANHCAPSRYAGGVFFAATLNENIAMLGAAVPFTTTQPNRENVVVLSRANSSSAAGGLVGLPILNPSDASSIDIKFDDGKPAYGFIQSFIPSAATIINNCASGDTATTATYRVSDSSVQCSLLFVKAF